MRTLTGCFLAWNGKRSSICATCFQTTARLTSPSPVTALPAEQEVGPGLESAVPLTASEHDHYLCPQGQTLRLASRRQSEQVFVYTGEDAVCNACPMKAECTDSQSGRQIFRSFFQDDLDRVEAYQKALRKRSVWVEPLFGEAKQFHGLRRFWLRGYMTLFIM